MSSSYYSFFFLTKIVDLKYVYGFFSSNVIVNVYKQFLKQSLC